jgi:phosphate transport system substrate-binding protein
MHARAFAALSFGAALLLPLAAQSDDTTLTAAGSTALLPLFKASSGAYESRYPGTQVTISGGGSRAGVAAVAAGTVDLGMSDTPAVGYSNLVDHQVCVVGFSVVANPGIGVTGLSKRQLRDVFAGKVTNWKQLGGADLQIVPIDRPKGSASRVAFEHAIGAGGSASNALEDLSATLLGDVRATPGAIAYVAFVGTKKYVDGAFTAIDGVRELSIDGARPTEEDIAAGRYPFWSYEHAYTNGSPGRQASRFLALVETNAEAIRDLGFIPLRVMGAVHSEGDL